MTLQLVLINLAHMMQSFFPFKIRSSTMSNEEESPHVVQVASTKNELEQIYRLRYSIYCVELKRDYPDADHDKKWIRDDDDEEDYAVNLYISRSKDVLHEEQEIIAVARLNIFQPGQVPQMYSDMFALTSFPDWENIVTAELGRLMVSPTARGGTVFKSLIRV